jgi:hypothetical protein
MFPGKICASSRADLIGYSSRRAVLLDAFIALNFFYRRSNWLCS